MSDGVRLSALTISLREELGNHWKRTGSESARGRRGPSRRLRKRAMYQRVTMVRMRMTRRKMRVMTSRDRSLWIWAMLRMGKRAISI
jgi:hypothetical protein